ARLAHRLAEFDELAERKSGPRNGHRPRLDASEPVEAFLQLHAADQILGVDRDRLFHQAADVDPPRMGGEALGELPDLIALETELVEDVVPRGELFGRERLVEGKGGISRSRVETLRGSGGNRSGGRGRGGFAPERRAPYQGRGGRGR